MKRTVLTLTLALFFGFVGLAWSQLPAQRVIIMDSTGTHAASVSGGTLSTTAGAGGSGVTSHISSVTHIAGTVRLSNTEGTVVTVTGTSLDVNCTGCAAASVVNVGHVSGALHIAGSINGAMIQVQGVGTAGASHGGVLSIQGVASGTTVPVSGTVAATQSGAWNVSAAQSGAFVVTAAHIIGGSGHIAITQAAAALQVDCSNCSAASVVAVSHISSAVHVAAVAQPVHVVGVSIVNSTYPLPCHSSMAFHTSARATTIAHANSGMKIYICGLLLLSQSSDSISVVEGQGTSCATGRQELIGHTQAAMALTSNSGFSAVQPFPWINSKTAGNAVCLIKGRADQHVSGVITYRGAP